MDWNAYFDEMFDQTNVFVNEDEKIIVREPDYFDGLLALLNNTSQNVIGT